MEMSGVDDTGWIFGKFRGYVVHEVVPTSEEHIFYDLLIKYGYKLDLNNCFVGSTGRKKYTVVLGLNLVMVIIIDQVTIIG